MQPADSFGYLVKRLRKALDLTQVELAIKVGCTAAAIRKIEADERKPSLQIAELLADHLLVPIERKEAFLQAARHILSPGDLAMESISLAPITPKEHLDFHTNLPAPLTLLIDRKQELKSIVEMVLSPAVRLLTLVGPPGIGKTRLSILCGRELGGEFPDGVWFVDLSMVTNPALVIPSIGRVFFDQKDSQAADLQRLCNWLRKKRLLLILDNFEQVAEGAALDVAEILRACPNLKILVTSRVSLFVYGEHEYSVPPLALPPHNAALNAADLMQSDAVCLFVMRLRQHNPRFDILPENAADVVAICNCMSGIPLALELAAATVRTIPISQLAAILADKKSRFWLELLKTKSRDLPLRQRTLYQAITWSYSLLDPNEQRLFRSLAVFEGSFDAQAVKAVCHDPMTPAQDVNQTLDYLTDCYLLSQNQETAQPRWFLLEVIREFAWETLLLEERLSLQQRHAFFYDQLLTEFIETKPLTELARYFQSNSQNLNAALKWAIHTQNTGLAFHLANHLSWLWETQGYQAEGLAFLPDVLKLTGEVEHQIYISVLHRAANLAWMQQKFEIATIWIRQAIQLSLNYQLDDQYLDLLLALARIYLEQELYEMASEKIDECLRKACDQPELMNPGFPLALSGEIALAKAQIAKARSLFSEAVDLLDKNSVPFMPMAQTGLAQAALEDGEYALSWNMLRAAFPLARLHIRRLRFFMLTLADLLVRESVSQQKNAVLAAKLIGSVTGLGEKSSDRLSVFAQDQYQRIEQLIREIISVSEWQNAWDIGDQWTVDEAVAQIKAYLYQNEIGERK